MKRTESIRRIQSVLIKRREALRRTLRFDLADLRHGADRSSGDSGDAALIDCADELSAQLVECDSRELQHIDGALERIRRGQFGMCDSCGKEIPAARLQVLPYALRCVSCQRESESNRIVGSGDSDWSRVDEPREDIDRIGSFFVDQILEIR